MSLSMSEPLVGSIVTLNIPSSAFCNFLKAPLRTPEGCAGRFSISLISGMCFTNIPSVLKLNNPILNTSASSLDPSAFATFELNVTMSPEFLISLINSTQRTLISSTEGNFLFSVSFCNASFLSGN